MGSRRTSAPGCARRSHTSLTRGACGFTLIEMVVTLVVMSIIIAIAIPNLLTSSGAVLGREARKLALFMELVHDEAMTRGENLGISFNKESPVLWREGEEDWVETKSDDLPGDAALENGVKIAGAWVGQREVSSQDRIVFTASGSITPYSLKLAYDGREADLKGDIFGRVSITERRSGKEESK